MPNAWTVLSHISVTMAVLSLIPGHSLAQGGPVTDFFTRDLRIGDIGVDVEALQVFLNQDQRTALGSTGPGSPGFETNYYGPITASAASRFQDLYASEVLHPLGLFSGTGFMGPSTRKKLNRLYALTLTISESPVPLSRPVAESELLSSGFKAQVAELLELSGFPRPEPGSPDDTRQQQFIAQQNDTYIFSVLPYVVQPGETIVLDGYGFSQKENTLIFDGDSTDIVRGVPSHDGRTIIFMVDSSMTEEETPDYGRHSLVVRSGARVSNTRSFIIKDPGAISPRISDFSPQGGSWGSRVTVVGRGFTRNDNEVHTPLGIVREVSSTDGSTLVFEMPLFGFTQESRDIQTHYLDSNNGRVPFIILNANGTTPMDNIAHFTFERYRR